MREITVTELLVLWIKGLFFYLVLLNFLPHLAVSYLWLGFCLEYLNITNPDDETDEYFFLVLMWPLVLYRIKTNS